MIAQHMRQKILGYNMNKDEECMYDIKKLSDRLKTPFFNFAKHGWYVEPRMDLYYLDNENIFDENSEEGDLLFSNYYEREFDSIVCRIVGNNKHRSAILEDARRAHLNGSYNLSVPVFLLQADGICWDKFEEQAYAKTKKGDRAKIYDKINSDENGSNNSFLKLLSAVFSIPMPINENSMYSCTQKLNRHSVIHGTESNYGTKLNSLKSLLFVSFIDYTSNEYKP